MGYTYTSPTEATIIAVVWQLDDWCDANRAAGLASIDAYAAVTARAEAVVTACLSMDAAAITAAVDNLLATLADRTVDVGLVESDIAECTCTLRELLHELSW